MPGYIFANKDQRGTTNVNYRMEIRGDKWWYERETVITQPNGPDQIHRQWFGPYDSEIECMRMIEASNNDAKINTL